MEIHLESDAIEGPLPTMSLSYDTTIYFTDLELLEYIVIPSTFQHVSSTISSIAIQDFKVINANMAIRGNVSKELKGNLPTELQNQNEVKLDGTTKL